MEKRQFTPIKAVISILIIIFIFISSFNIQGKDTSPLSTMFLNEEDSIYYIDDFSSAPLIRENCIIPSGNTKITLNPQGSQEYNYNFSQWSVSTAIDHKAFFYNIIYFPIFFQKEFIIKYFATEFDSEFGYPYLRSLDGNTFPMQSFATPTSFQQIHHFRIKISQNIDSISQIKGSWYGNGDKVEKLTLYVWESLYESIGLWREMDMVNNTDEPTSLSFQFTEDFPVDDAGYLDFCIVLTPTFSNKCTLFSDFINLEVQGSGYAVQGYIQTNPISPQSIASWERAGWSDYQPQNTNIKYQILYENETGVTLPVPNSYLPGNSGKFTSGPLNLKKIPQSYNLSINASFTTTDLSISPELYSIGLSWQKNQSIWRDGFSSTMRTQREYQDNIKIFDGNASLIQSVFDWPMINHNPTNTRKTPGLGPGSSHNNILWFSNITVGGEQRQPIVKNDHLYIGSYDGSQLIMFQQAQATTGLFAPNNDIIEKDLQYDIKNTPCATDKDTIVVATGSSSEDGIIENIIYAFDDMTLADEWSFQYKTIDSENPYICYDSSPIIHNNKIYVTSWSGNTNVLNTVWEYFNLSSGNNKLLCLSDQGAFQWSFDLPAASFSSPAVTDDLIIVGCENLINSSIFAVNMNGMKVWEKDVGPIGKAAPMIYDDKVFIVSKKLCNIPFKAYTQITALQLSTGAKIWNRTLGDSIPDNYYNAGFLTPCIADDDLIVATPDGLLYSLNPDNGERIWAEPKSIYVKNILNTYMTSSPSYADGFIFIGTPDGYIRVFDTDGTEKWFKKSIGPSPIISSPIIVDGLVYYYAENGIIYCRGKVQIPQGQQISGSLVSILIDKPTDENLTWNYFYASSSTTDATIRYSILDANYNVLLNDIEDGYRLDTEPKLNNKNSIRLKADFTANTNGEAFLDYWAIYFGDDEYNITEYFSDSFTTKDIPPNCSIDVQNSNIGINVTTAKFKLEYYDENVTFHTTNYISTNCTGENISTNRETITVNLSSYNFTKNMTFHRIRFSINNGNDQITYSDWFMFNQQSIPDIAQPVFDLDSFTPVNQYIANTTPICTITVKDTGTNNNITGINTGSAKYEIKYRDEQGIHTDTFTADCSGSNGTKNTVVITADISDLSFSDNITELFRIRFYIKDIAGNENTSSWFDLEIDDIAPISTISNSDSIETFINSSSVEIIITASDDLSGISDVGLLFRKTDTTDWTLFETKKTEPPYIWNFTIDENSGGEYELQSIASDTAGNKEPETTTGDVVFVFDPNEPKKPQFSSLYEFLNTDQIASFDDVTFEDDYLLDSVYYRMNFDAINDWEKINTDRINKKTFTPTWNLTEEQWNEMDVDTESPYFIFFKITDVLGNMYITPNEQNTMKIKKISESSHSSLYTDFTDFDSWSWDNKYTISIDINNSEVQSLVLYYSYSEENTTNHSWIQYGNGLVNNTTSWTFSPEDGEGYYSFKVEMTDNQGIVYSSEIYTVFLSDFPLIELGALIVLFVLFICITIFLYRKRKKISI